MRIYIVHPKKLLETQIREKLASILPADGRIDVRYFSNNIDALVDIKKAKEPILLIIDRTRIPVNGKDFITIAKEYVPYLYSIVVSDEGDNLDLDVPYNKSLSIKEALEEKFGEILKSAQTHVNLVSKLNSGIIDIKKRVNNIEKKAISWSKKIAG